MVYVAGQPDHRLQNADIVAHLVGMVERKAAEIEAAKAAETAVAAAPLPVAS
jgi:(E)-4-hydroxy-3-methylbut-2-enyl-diphosphate synthase